MCPSHTPYFHHADPRRSPCLDEELFSRTASVTAARLAPGADVLTFLAKPEPDKFT